ncbi:shikimate dehydrogenase family protein [Streptomyces gamaensis]|uniref:Shikimate dehydrogenase family protein n=1 Tax=Streptomyces gamaensis TaxID=1763542 RepID=A0ABW0YXG4_9ACTN
MRPDVPSSVTVSGTTRLLAVLGDPVAQVRAPALLNPLFARLGHDAVLVPVHASPEDLPAVVRGLKRVRNLDGLLVTVPHKIAALRFADVVGATAAAVGSTNALRREADGRWRAENFDGSGFVAGLRAAGHDPEGRRAVLAGAGGAGSAVAAALLEAGVARLTVCDPDSARLRALCARLERYRPGRTAAAAPADLPGRGPLGDCDLAVNATPLGMRPDDPLPFPPQELPPGAVVADIVMKPEWTPLLTAAAGLGLTVHHGHHMLDHQLGFYCGFFGFGEVRDGGPAG